MTFAVTMFRRRLKSLSSQMSASTSVEYAVMLSLIALLAAGAILTFSTGTRSMSDHITDAVMDASKDQPSSPAGHLSETSVIHSTGRPNRDR